MSSHKNVCPDRVWVDALFNTSDPEVPEGENLKDKATPLKQRMDTFVHIDNPIVSLLSAEGEGEGGEKDKYSS